MIRQGQKEGSVIDRSPVKLADYYWGVVYLYALKKLFTTKYEMISAEDLAHVLLKDEQEGNLYEENCDRNRSFSMRALAIQPAK